MSRVEIEINEALIKAVSDIPLTLRNGPLGRCLGSFAIPIARQAGSLATSSRETGSRERWSKRFKNNAAFQNDSKQHFSHKVLRNGIGVYIGATYPKGNKQQFVMPIKKGDSYDRYHWGKPGQTITTTSRRGTTYTYIRGQSKNKKKNANKRNNPTTARFSVQERATVRAFDQTKQSAESAFLAQLQKEIKEIRFG
jgi:hypothetical protein